jgi:hypothetical protein
LDSTNLPLEYSIGVLSAGMSRQLRFEAYCLKDEIDSWAMAMKYHDLGRDYLSTMLEDNDLPSLFGDVTEFADLFSDHRSNHRRYPDG